MTRGRVCIFGASGGIGRAMTELIARSDRYDRIYACSRTSSPWAQANIVPLTFDLTDEASIATVAARIAADGPLDLVIVATGILHHGVETGPEKSWGALDPAAMAALFTHNTIGPALIAKHVLPIMRREGRAVFAVLSARVGSIEDNRAGGWHSYRASKAALNMLVRNFAIELKRRNGQSVVIALHPGTVDTALSGPFQRNLPTGQLMAPHHSAMHLLRVVDDLAPEQSGGFYDWNGRAVPF